MIAETLRSLSTIDYGGPVEVIVVDDGSQDRTLKSLPAPKTCSRSETPFRS